MPDTNINEYDTMYRLYKSRAMDLIHEGTSKNDQILIDEGNRLLSKASDLNLGNNTANITAVMPNNAQLQLKLADANAAIKRIDSIHKTINVLAMMIALVDAIKSGNITVIDSVITDLNNALNNSTFPS